MVFEKKEKLRKIVEYIKNLVKLLKKTSKQLIKIHTKRNTLNIKP